MKYRKFWTLAFCVSLSCGVPAQPASDDQSRALDALRQAETSAAPASAPAKETPAPAPAVGAHTAPCDTGSRTGRKPPPRPATRTRMQRCKHCARRKRRPRLRHQPLRPSRRQRRLRPPRLLRWRLLLLRLRSRQNLFPPIARTPTPHYKLCAKRKQRHRQRNRWQTWLHRSRCLLQLPRPRQRRLNQRPANPALDALRQQESQPELSREQRDAEIRQQKLDAMRRKREGGAAMTPQSAPTTQAEPAPSSPWLLQRQSLWLQQRRRLWPKLQLRL